MLRYLERPIDKAILIYFRIGAGLLMAMELINSLVINKIAEYYQPQFHFSYLFFEWVKPWPMEGMYLHYAVTILAGIMVAIGIQYRFWIIVLFLGQTTLFLMEMSEYINHHYLYCLISFWMIFMPLKDDGKQTAPAWVLYLILFHMSLAYFFAGIAKLNSDWLSGSPMNLYLRVQAHHPLSLLFSYGGALFDLFIVPAMIIPKTRKWGLAASICFHISNVSMFGLATFPWFSLLLTSMFFNPSWPRKIPGFARLITPNEKEERHTLSPLLFSCLMIYGAIHVLLPLRHHLYPMNASWSEEGHMFAWRMMLREKSARAIFHVQNLTTKKMVPVNPASYLTAGQVKDLNGHPDMILQFAHHLRDEYRRRWQSDVAVYASARVSLNGKPKRELIKPGTNLALEERSLKPYRWILK